MPRPKRQAAILRPSQIRHVLNVTAATSVHPERDCLALLLSLCAGMRVTEIARLEIRDVLMPGGALRQESQLRSETTKNCRARVVFLTSPKLRAALEAYLAHRLKHRQGTSLDHAKYRGLMPETRLLLSSRGAGYSLNTKRRTNRAGERIDYQACDALENRFRELYRAAGLRRCSSHSGRRTYSTRLLNAGVSLDTLVVHAEYKVTH